MDAMKYESDKIGNFFMVELYHETIPTENIVKTKIQHSVLTGQKE